MSGGNGHRAESECPICPAWVLRCAHWEGRILVAGGKYDLSGPYDVWMGSGLVAAADAPDGLYLPPIDGKRRDFPFLNRKAAEAEFRKREAALLGRDPE